MQKSSSSMLVLALGSGVDITYALTMAHEKNIKVMKWLKRQVKDAIFALILILQKDKRNYDSILFSVFIRKCLHVLWYSLYNSKTQCCKDVEIYLI